LHGSPSGAIGFPNGIGAEEAEPITKYLNDNLMPMADWGDFEASLSHNAHLSAEVIRHLSEINDGVSPCFQIGIHSLVHGAIVSEISCDGLLSLSLRAPG
jgi:hypothetical protein